MATTPCPVCLPQPLPCSWRLPTSNFNYCTRFRNKNPPPCFFIFCFWPLRGASWEDENAPVLSSGWRLAVFHWGALAGNRTGLRKPLGLWESRLRALQARWFLSGGESRTSCSKQNGKALSFSWNCLRWTLHQRFLAVKTKCSGAWCPGFKSSLHHRCGFGKALCASA